MADDYCFLRWGSSKAIHLTSWNHPAVNSVKQLPLGSLYYDISNVIAEVPIHPLALTDLISLPLLRKPFVSYQALRAPLEQLLLADWLDMSPPVPLSYQYCVSLIPHAFTGLSQFVCSRIREIRTGASQQAAHISWKS